MASFRLGPVAQRQFARYRSVAVHGQHIVISGPTGSGKTRLIPELIRPRIERNGFVMVFVMKPKPDPTILENFGGWTRWKKFHKHPKPYENRVLLWPDTKGMTMKETLEHQRKIFEEAFDGLFQTGNWTIVVDEGLYTVYPMFLNMASQLAMLHSVGRTLGDTIITLTQRPAHLPLIVYSSASHAFIGRTTEASDMKRLSELGGRESSRTLAVKMSELGKHDFLWVPIDEGWPAEVVNLSK